MYLGDFFILIEHETPTRIPEQQTHAGRNLRPIKYLPLNIIAVLATGRRHHAHTPTKLSHVIAMTKVAIFKKEVRALYDSHAEFMDAVRLRKIKAESTGFSYCSESDAAYYSKRKGLLIALNRALSLFGMRALYTKGKGWKLYEKPLALKAAYGGDAEVITTTKPDMPADAAHAIGHREDNKTFLPGHDDMLAGGE